jgi:hypothetical protein
VTDESKAALADSLLKVGTQLGVPVLILAAFLWMAREAGFALYSGAVVPIVEAHTRFLESTESTLKEIGTTQKQQAETMQEIVVGQREIATMIEARRGDN